MPGTAGLCLDANENALCAAVLHAIPAADGHDVFILRKALAELDALRKLIDQHRQLREETTFGGQTRTVDGLITHLMRLDGLDGDLSLPMKASLSRTYLLAKINCLRAFIKAATRDHMAPGLDPVRVGLRSELAQSIYTLLAEELFLALLRKQNIAAPIKQAAARQLILIWDDAALEIDDFAPILESAWRARNRYNSECGTLLGASETMRLAYGDCHADVLDYFARDDKSESEQQAFEEFLFNMTFEEVSLLRTEMRARGMTAASRAWAAQILGRKMEDFEAGHEIDPLALYRSYQRRQLAADFRAMAGAPGPRRTAEAYLLIDVLAKSK